MFGLALFGPAAAVLMVIAICAVVPFGLKESMFVLVGMVAYQLWQWEGPSVPFAPIQHHEAIPTYCNGAHAPPKCPCDSAG
mmetsp:Transcript_13743/g.37184  ORF Transcript_13743/g.37184 Transcript_13743/m.37184 type:complete len:81 (-) Transcript_13743:441-683(-)